MSNESMGSAVSSIMLKADSGYQGFASYHGKSELPTKKPKGGQLMAEEKAANRRLSSERVLMEHIYHRIKIFKIMPYPYRNRRKRHYLRLSPLCYTQ